MSLAEVCEVEATQLRIARKRALLEQVRAIKLELSESRNTEEALKVPWEEYILNMRFLAPQTYGVRLEKYLIKFYGWTGIHSSENQGDARRKDNSAVEIKVSMPAQTGGQARFLQIRPYQKVSTYLFFVIDSADKVWRFDLTKDQLMTELAEFGSASHGTKSVAEQNAYCEYSLTLGWGENNARTERWKKNYLATSEPTPDQMLPVLYQDAASLVASEISE